MSADTDGQQLYAACLCDPQSRAKQCEAPRCYRTDTEPVRIEGGRLAVEDTERRLCRYHGKHHRRTTS